MNEIQRQHSIQQLCAAYQIAEDKIYNQCAELKQTLQEALENGISGDYSRSSDVDRLERDMIVNLRQKTWSACMNKSGVVKVLSMKRLDAFDKVVFSNDPPVPTFEAVMENLLSGNASELFSEMVMEVYDFLMVGQTNYNQYKTNTKNARTALGEKIILHVFGDRGHFFGSRGVFMGWSEGRLLHMDKIFHMLAGVPFDYDKYRSPFLDALIENDVGETEFFSWKSYQNGNVHLTFKRDDLLKLFNQIAGGKKMVLGD